MHQKTIRKAVTIEGIGVHSGKKATLTLKPAPANSGIAFIRTDLAGNPRITANYKNISCTRLATTLGSGNATISTVEHVMAALYGHQIDNLVIEVDGPEVPIMDGSAAPFFEGIRAVGVQAQRAPVTFIEVAKKIEVKIDGKWAVAEPFNGLEVQGSIEWDHPSIGYQNFKYTQGKTLFNEIMDSRTFGFVKEVDALRRMGLCQGGSLENAVVMDDVSVLNPEGLRTPDEFIRHKVLDALGDFKLSGNPLMAKIRLHRAGHDVHYRLLAAIFESAANYRLVSRTKLPASTILPELEVIPA